MFSVHPKNKQSFLSNKYHRVLVDQDYESITGRVKVPAGSIGTISMFNRGIYGVVFDNEVDRPDESRLGGVDIPYHALTMIASIPPRAQDIVESYACELSQGNLIADLLEKETLPVLSDYFKTNLIQGISKKYYDELLRNDVKPSLANAVLLDAFREIAYRKAL